MLDPFAGQRRVLAASPLACRSVKVSPVSAKTALAPVNCCQRSMATCTETGFNSIPKQTRPMDSAAISVVPGLKSVQAFTSEEFMTAQEKAGKIASKYQAPN